MVGASIYARFNPPAFAALKGTDAPVIEGHELSYSCVNQLQEYLREERGLDVGLWRSVGPGYTKFAIESFIDEIARGQRIDPVQFRLRLLAHNPRAAAVVRRVADWAEWDRKRKNGHALGLAFSDTWRTYIASVVEASVDREAGVIRVHEVWSDRRSGRRDPAGQHREPDRGRHDRSASARRCASGSSSRTAW